MRLLNATLRNYRVHRELKVAFDPARTLVGGPNEAGKSTLVEAIHHALFLRHKISGEYQQGLVPRAGGGHPEVEVAFEVNGRRYAIFKRFGGAGQGFVSLTETGGGTWRGDEAESRLAQLLGVSEPTSGRGAAERSKEQWAHLWVWQGQSSRDPLQSTRAEHTALLQRLQAQQGAVVGQSALDEQVAANLEDELSAHKTPTGKAKAGGPLEAAFQACTRAQDTLREKQARLDALEEATKGSDLARMALAEAEAARVLLLPQWRALEEKEAMLQQLQTQEAGLAEQAERLAEVLTGLQAAEAEIDQLRMDRAQCAAAAAPRRQALTDKREAVAAAVTGYEEVQKELLQANEVFRLARERQALADAQTRSLERAELLGDLAAQWTQAETRQGSHQALEQALSRLPRVTHADVEALTQRVHAVEQAQATLAAMAAGIEVLSAPGGVWVAGEELRPGETRVVTEATEVDFPDGTRLRIQPGGGDALRAAREASVSAQQRLREALAGLVVGSREEAVQIADQREKLQREIEMRAAELEAMQAHTLLERLSEARTAYEAAVAEAERRSALLQTPEPLPATLAASQLWAQQLQQHVERAEAEKQSLERLKAERENTRDRLRAEAEALEASLRLDETESARFETLLADRLQNHGTDAARQHALLTAAENVEQAEQKLGSVRAQIEILQPEALGLERERLERAARNQQEQAVQAEEALRLHTHTLRSDGSLDPAAEVAFATAELERVEEARARVTQRVAALEMLVTKFREQRRRLVERYTAPLVTKIEHYARCVFGPQTRLNLETNQETGALAEVQLDRGVNHAFLELSQGAKEQLSVAVRFAVVELLADTHGEGLPVILDDAFANADPHRVQLLQGMLDLAAARGLQVVVLSCTPGDYAGLGAHTIILPAR